MGAVFALFAGFYYWIGKITGYAYPETWGKIHFWVMFVGVYKKLAPTNLAWCWNIYKKGLSYTESNHTEDYILVNSEVGVLRMTTSGIKGSDIENDNQEKGVGKPSYRQSAGVCDHDEQSSVVSSSIKMTTKEDIVYTAASQRIYAKELWYMLGFIEGDGSIACYREKTELRVELSIGLQAADIKLVYQIRDWLGYGTVRKVKYSNTKYQKAEATGGELPMSARFNVRSKEKLQKDILAWYTKYPALTNNKRSFVEWARACIKQNELLSREEVEVPIRELEKLMVMPYVKDWIIGFIEADGLFYETISETKITFGFNLIQIDEFELLEWIGKVMGLTMYNRVSRKASNACILTAVSKADLQAVVNFMTHPERMRLQGLKRVTFEKWLKGLRSDERYKDLVIPKKY